jgi:hypothetical protein
LGGVVKRETERYKRHRFRKGEEEKIARVGAAPSTHSRWWRRKERALPKRIMVSLQLLLFVSVP